MEESRRKFLKRSAYVAPAIVTLKAVPAFAGSGSGYTSERKESSRSANSALR